jgi:tetratricopeptide (TPR) repeat protein
MFKNMPRAMRDTLTAAEQSQRVEAMHLLLLNIALCHLKRNNPREAVKACKEAIDLNGDNPKAYYRLGVAQKANGELEPAKESLL